MKKLLLLAVLFLLTLNITMLSTVCNAAEKKKLVVGLAWNEKVHPLIQAWQDYMIEYGEEYGKENGIEFEWIINVADSDPIQQASNIDDLIASGVDVIVARPHDAASIGASIRAAHEDNILFITFDRTSSTIKPDAHVGADSLNQAISTGEEFAKILKKNGVEGKVIELMGDLRDINAVQRSDGWHKVEDAGAPWKTIVQVPTEWNPEKFRSGTANALEAHPEANAIFVASDFCFSAVESALESAGRLYPVGDPKHIWIAVQDINPPGYTAMKKGYIDVGTTYDAYYHARELIKVLGMIAKGEKLNGESYLVAGRVATPENVDTLKNLWSKPAEK